jgi:hypothetical protein
MSKTFSLILLVLCFLSCKNEPLIPEEKFIKVYVDILFIQDTTSIDKSLDSLKQIVFNKYDITDEMYENNVKYYNENPEKWEAFFDKATAYVEKLKSEQDE